MGWLRRSRKIEDDSPITTPFNETAPVASPFQDHGIRRFNLPQPFHEDLPTRFRSTDFEPSTQHVYKALPPPLRSAPRSAAPSSTLRLTTTPSCPIQQEPPCCCHDTNCRCSYENDSQCTQHQRISPYQNVSRPVVNYFVTISPSSLVPAARPDFERSPNMPFSVPASLVPARGRLLQPEQFLEHQRVLPEEHTSQAPVSDMTNDSSLTVEISSKFNSLMALVELGEYREKHHGLSFCHLNGPNDSTDNTIDDYQTCPTESSSHRSRRKKTSTKPKGTSDKDKSRRSSPKSSKSRTTSASLSRSTLTNFVARASQYANSRLPPNLPPMRCSLESWRLVCLAARYSLRAYDDPKPGSERKDCFEPSWRTGSKAMVIKSVTIDGGETIVFAIRGSASVLDWLVNLNAAPAAPTEFLVSIMCDFPYRAQFRLTGLD